MGDLNYNTDQTTINKIFISLLIEVLNNQHIILDKLASYDSISTGQSKDEVIKCYDNTRNTSRQVVKEQLFEVYGPDFAEELGL